jgi:D-alanine-D-alanine ligase-like ATP-grasp enzyme
LANKRVRVGIIFGGRSSEHEVSLRSACSIMDAIDKGKYDVMPIGITKQGRWIAGGDPLAALVAGGAIDCAGLARVDIFAEKDSGKVWMNELNTIPGFTSISMYPKLWEVSGISYPDLFDRRLKLALERHADKSRNKTTCDPEAE